MNVNMWENPANLRNIELLKKDNIHILGPVNGIQAAVMWEWANGGAERNCQQSS